ncbi:MAG: type II toxin-antitoxin system HigB family toxin [Sulfuritalea sp.]|nr:type II toxin-antitoxin system HigB family toxin [Sulfuritalea sp.]MBK8118442.1 type II toxin-antitoxin system HigB family toxin [Sulfuritalea sp.]
MRVVAKSSLVKFWSQPGHADSQGALQSWYDETIKADWKSPQNIKDQYCSASICAGNRVVFNIAGNKYQLVVEMQYRAGIAWVEFVGTHARYDQFNVETVNEY